MVDTAVVLMVEGADAELVLRAAAGTDVQVDATVELARETTSPEGPSTNGERSASAVCAHNDDMRRDRETICSLIGVPMFVERTIVGVLVAGAQAQRDFSHEDISLLKLAADRAAIAIENARLYRKAQETLSGGTGARPRCRRCLPRRREGIGSALEPCR